ncbi:MAG: hypothetical protein IPM98_17860 [Lewinellaceae bacterium]|nr:hypothetical protein [Lewinellaceae bacterium]
MRRRSSRNRTPGSIRNGQDVAAGRDVGRAGAGGAVAPGVLVGGSAAGDSWHDGPRTVARQNTSTITAAGIASGGANNTISYSGEIRTQPRSSVTVSWYSPGGKLLMEAVCALLLHR